MKIPKFIKRFFCFSTQRSEVITTEAIPPTLDTPHEEVNQPATANYAFMHGLLHYGNCIILSVSQLAQLAISVFAPGRTGEAAAEAIDRVGQVAAIVAHETADRIEDNDFYTERAQLERAIQHPDIEAWAEYMSRRVNAAAALANVATQLTVTGRMPITTNHIIMATHSLMLFSSTIGYPLSESTLHVVQSMSLYQVAHSITSMRAPTAVAAIAANSFFDWLSDDVIRVAIYAATDSIEDALGRIYGVHGPVNDPNIIPQHENDQELNSHQDMNNGILATSGILIAANLIIQTLAGDCYDI